MEIYSHRRNGAVAVQVLGVKPPFLAPLSLLRFSPEDRSQPREWPCPRLTLPPLSTSARAVVWFFTRVRALQQCRMPGSRVRDLVPI